MHVFLEGGSLERASRDNYSALLAFLSSSKQALPNPTPSPLCSLSHSAQNGWRTQPCQLLLYIHDRCKALNCQAVSLDIPGGLVHTLATAAAVHPLNRVRLFATP